MNIVTGLRDTLIEYLAKTQIELSLLKVPSLNYNCSSYGLYCLYACKPPSILCTSPKSRVKPTTNATANQKLYHWAGRRLSRHHWIRDRGSASSKSCFRTTRRSCQYSNLSICRSSLLSCPHSRIMQSSCRWACCFCSHFTDATSNCGNRSDSVRCVSAIRPGGNTLLPSVNMLWERQRVDTQLIKNIPLQPIL
jgi:hypothetical protein